LALSKKAGKEGVKRYQVGLKKEKEGDGEVE